MAEYDNYNLVQNMQNGSVTGNSLQDSLMMDGISEDQFKMWAPEKQMSYTKEKGFTPSNNVVGLDPNSEGWWDSMSGLDATKLGLGVGQLGLGIAGYLDNKKTAGKQRELMGQQIASNRFLLDQAQGRQKDIGKAFGGGGLAASTRTV